MPIYYTFSLKSLVTKRSNLIVVEVELYFGQALFLTQGTL